VKGRNRKEAIEIAKRALREFHITGVFSTIPFHLYMLEDKRFLENDYTLSYVDSLIAEGCLFSHSESEK
jgi:acetyl-CoA carboxylase biotin carboxylase subunit